jgi:DNA excision repair protein ERCC-5
MILIQVYLAEDARRELGLKREDFIALAYFLGSDYTEGIHGIGIVNSMEIIQAFPIEVNEEEGSVQGILKSLQKFKEWLQGYDFVKDILEEMKAKELKRQPKQKQNQEKHQKKRKKKRTREESEEDEEKDEVTMEEIEEKSDEDNEDQKEKNNLLVRLISWVILSPSNYLAFLL